MPIDPNRAAVRDINSGANFYKRPPKPIPRVSPGAAKASAASAKVRAYNQLNPFTKGRSFSASSAAAGNFRDVASRKARQKAFGGVASKAAVATKVRPPLPKIPTIPGGGIFKKALPFVSTFATFYDLVNLAESSAPGVHDWLRGGWKGATPTTSSDVFDSGKCPVLYAVTYTAIGAIFNTGPMTYPNAQGPIAEIRPVYQGSSKAEYRIEGGSSWFSLGGGSSPSRNPTVGLKDVSIARMDGQPDECGDPRSESQPVGYPPRPTNPTQSNNPAASPSRPSGSPPKPQTPTLDPPTQPGDDEKRDPSNPPFPGNLPFPILVPGKAPGTSPDAEPQGTPPAPFPDGSNCSGGCNGQLRSGQEALNDQLNSQNDKINDLLNKINAASTAETLRKLQTIDDKLGPQILGPTGVKIGITGKLTSIATTADKWFRRLGGDRALQALTLAASLHNAAMLSNNLGQTLTAAVSNVLASVGVKDAEGNPFDIGQILGERWQDFLVSTIGLENYTQLSITWLRANRIMQAGANIINSIQSIRMAIMGALEAIGSMSARIGNALKKYGVVGDNAYSWFNPSPNYDNKFFQAIEQAENFTSNVDQVASEVLSAQESVSQLGQQKTDLDNALINGTEQPLPDNVQQYLKRQAEKTASESPDIATDDFIKPEAE